MFIQGSRKLGLAICALAVVVGQYVAVNASLSMLASRFEADGEVFPYKSEDWLRFLLPGFFANDGRPVLMLTGPSSVREDFSVEIFQREFPEYRVFQGGLSLGTMEDVFASLKYMEGVYGPEALPAILVLGLSPRFLGEIPAQRPFVPAVNRYGSHHCTIDAEGEIHVTAKSGTERLWADFRFRTQKQTPRYQVAVLSAVRSFLPENFDENLRRSWVAKLVGGRESGLRRGFGAALRVGPRHYISDLVSPYKYRSMSKPDLAGIETWISSPNSFWAQVYAWNPAVDAESIRARISRFLEFIRERNIRLFVFNMPEREVSRLRYDPAHYARYQEIFEEGFSGWPLLDLREVLEDDAFHDVVHLTEAGATQATDIVISFLREPGGRSEGPSQEELSTGG